jgi:hypothetical protein
VDLKAYFRRRLAETLAQPDAASILSANEFTPQIEPVEMLDVPLSMMQSAGANEGFPMQGREVKPLSA